MRDLYSGTSIPITALGRINVSAAEIDARRLEDGDIVFGRSPVKREGIGYPSRFRGADEDVVYTGFAFRTRVRSEVADRFVAMMDRFMPNWQSRRDVLNRLPVPHESWGY